MYSLFRNIICYLILAGHFRGRDSQNERMAMLPAEGGNQVKFQYSNL